MVEIDVSLIANCNDSDVWLSATLFYDWYFRDLYDYGSTFQRIDPSHYGNHQSGTLRISARDLGPSLFKIMVSGAYSRLCY